MKLWIVRGYEKLHGRVHLIIEFAVRELEELCLKRRQPGRLSGEPNPTLLELHRLLLRALDFSNLGTEPHQPRLRTVLAEHLDQADTAGLLLDDNQCGLPFLF